MKIYVASSWRNAYQQAVVKLLRHLGHDVYDFRNPAPDNTGFAWSEIDQNWQSWSPDAYRKALEHPVAKSGYGLDIRAVRWCDAGVLVLPSGRSASWEFGHIMGQGKPGVVYMPEACEPELMYSEARILVSKDELRSHFQPISRRLGVNRIGMDRTMPRNKFLSAITPEQETQIQAILDRTCARTLIGVVATLLETRAAQAREVERFAASEELSELASRLFVASNGARV